MRILICTFVLSVATFVSAADKAEPLNPARIDEIAAMLSPSPTPPGKPVSDRAFWEKLVQEPSYRAHIKKADALAKKPLPEISDELFLEFSRTGNRTHYQDLEFARRARLDPLVFAECLTNQGKYLPALETLIKTLCNERTWVLPAHDAKLKNFHGTKITVDLFSSWLAWELSTADYLLGEKLDPATRKLLRKELKRRVLEPFRDMARGKRTADWWIAGTNNWNPVCLAGVTGTALIELEAPRDRAEYIAAGEQYSRNFLSDFPDDGYCSEGVGYWNYGYGRFALMAENFRLATHYKVDLFKDPDAAQPAAFGARITIINGVAPAYADCAIHAHPDKTLLWLLNRVYGWNNEKYGSLKDPGAARSLAEGMLYHDIQQQPVHAVSGSDISGAAGLRTAFEQAGVFICRPGSGAQDFAVSFKGGNNHEQHNHNDVGSYVVVCGDTPLLLDPGPETYTRRTFSGERYESKLLNSYGHPVPVIDGNLQRSGKGTEARIIRKDFSPTTDTVVMDISAAYKVPGLKKLIRTFEYGRENGGMFIVTDHVEYDAPKTFETAFISQGEFATAGDQNDITVQKDKSRVHIMVTSSAPFHTSKDVIKENAPVKPNRLALTLDQPVTSATIQMTIVPGGPQ